MCFFYLEGQPVTQACVERWTQMGWVELVEAVAYDHREWGGTSDWTEFHYHTIVKQ